MSCWIVAVNMDFDTINTMSCSVGEKVIVTLFLFPDVDTDTLESDVTNFEEETDYFLVKVEETIIEE